MKKVFVLAPREDWVCDRFVAEWNVTSHANITNTFNPAEADVLWLLAGWCWRQLPVQLLKTREVGVTIHHIDPQKFDAREFACRDAFVDWYHVPCDVTAAEVRKHTTKQVFVQPFWLNDVMWHPLDRAACKSAYDLKGRYVIGSFQRDTEGSDLRSPKLAKGPDVFVDVVDALRAGGLDVVVVLAGWRRQYIISRLNASGIEYRYFERCDQHTTNDLYNALDLYIVGSRCEGGPQALFECALTATPVVSTRVGAAELVLGADSDCIFDIGSGGPSYYHGFYDRHISAVDVVGNSNRVKRFTMPHGMIPFDSFLSKMRGI